MAFKVIFNSLEYDMVPNGFQVYQDRIIIRIFGEGISVDEVEAQLSDTSNLNLITIIYQEEEQETIIARYTQFNILQEIRKKPNSEFERYDVNRVLQRVLFNEIEITIRSIQPYDIVPQLQSDLDYIAIVEGIDLNTDEE